MKSDIILAGVGGQGILSIAAVIGMAAVDSGHFIKQAEVHGMSQRGGAVQSHLRISDQSISSDLIPEGSGDLILSVEPLESLRYLPYLRSEGWLITNSKPFVNIGNYPDHELLLEEIKRIRNHKIIDADSEAIRLGTVKVSNIVMLGAASHVIGLPKGSLEEAIRKIFLKKGEELVRLNLSALDAGRNAVSLN